MFWSVMIPTYNPEPAHLQQMLASVLAQSSDASAMEISVVDDCSPKDNVQSLVAEVAGDRVSFSRTSRNQGLAGCWNACVRKAQGEWVHILHQDDYILPGFYSEMEKIADSHPCVGLIAVRSFFIDSDGFISGVTPRVKSLEPGSRAVSDFLYDNPIQFPGVVVRKSAYESCGNFRADLSYTLDWEMWTRIIGEAGGVVSPEVLACYRVGAQNETSRLARTGATLADREKINNIFKERYQEFDEGLARRRACDSALRQAQLFEAHGDHQAAQLHMAYWRQHAPFTARARRSGRTALNFFRNALRSVPS